jgi:hypothetical protein
VPGTGEMREHA